MIQRPSVDEFVQSLIDSERMGSQVAYRTTLAPRPELHQQPDKPLLPAILQVIKAMGIQDLFRHQAQAIDLIRQNLPVVVATPTASGKTLIYNLPVLERCCQNNRSKALYLFPLKALAQDQLRTFEKMVDVLEGFKPKAAIYDGDTSAYRRKQIREAPPNVVFTNPDMLHLSLLAHHRKWAAFWSDLETVVIDEVHYYRGIMGSHIAQIFRRLQRICDFYGSAPTFVFSSATVANPAQLAEQLTGLHPKTISESGAPQGKRWLIFINPTTGPAQAAILLLKAALHRGLRTIVYTQSRKLTELIALWAGNQSGQFASKISAYRAGFLPEERREIEARLSNGDLLAVISTSALELGIDIGDLDLCLLVGYPGSVVSTWQRGGRVGRSGQNSALILIAGEDALDQYFIRNPSDFLQRKPETAVVNPFNPDIMAKHLVCAAAELTLKAHEPLLQAKNSMAVVSTLEKKGELLRSAQGDEFYTLRKIPHRNVDLRGTGHTFKIISTRTSEPKGEIDDLRAFRETHPGAIYLHRGETYLVDTLNLKTRTIKVSNVDVDYYTRVRSDKNVDILNIEREKIIGITNVYEGRIKVTDHVTEYEIWRIQANTLISRIPLDLPPQIFETEGIWFIIPPAVQRQVETKLQDFIGGIHAMEHAAISIFPLLVMADRNDLGGLAMPYNPQLASAVVFIYDGIQGGAGLTRQAFEQAEDLLAYTKRIIEECPCESGCPSCVHSPKCGSGNRPMDKAAAISILNGLDFAHGQSGISENSSITANRQQIPMPSDFPQEPVSSSQTNINGNNFRYGVLDIETRRSAAEVGGWHRADRMGVSCAILYDSRDNNYFEYLEEGLDTMLQHLQQLDLVIGFNIKKFDFQVLRGYFDFDFNALNCLDILEDVHEYLGFRLSLAHLTHVTLGAEKTADGLQALRWWQQGRIRDIIDYCKQDVKITRDLYLFGKEHGYLLFENKNKNIARIQVNWNYLL